MGKSNNRSIKPGARVEWMTSQGETRGTVKKKLTSSTNIKRHKVAASPDQPQFLVESEKSGKTAAHKPQALKQIEKPKRKKK
jgi:hypothetical protein